jgi:hypothetical protein
MPRVYELRDLITDPSNPCTYFQNFDDSIRDERSTGFSSKKQVWLARERELQRLDPESWQFLKSEARCYLMVRHPERGWEQLISILNQARGYIYLRDEGCLDVRFIPKSNIKGQETPELEGVLNGITVLCEVKTVHISDAEATRRHTGGVGDITNSLGKGFFDKLRGHLCKAKSQMESYESKEDVRRIVFIVLNFDDFFAEYKAEYFGQIDRYLTTRPISGIDIVFYNQKTVFHCHVAMQNAVVVNEPG